MTVEMRKMGTRRKRLASFRWHYLTSDVPLRSIQDKKKKKKKGKKEEKPVAASAAPPLSAAGKAILARQQQLAEEEARIKRLQEEQERKIREEEEREAAALKEIEDEKERKRKAKQDKIQAQKDAGTYMTKAEKEKAKKLAAKREAILASGLVPVVSGASTPSSAATASEDGAPKPPSARKKPAREAAASAEASANPPAPGQDGIADNEGGNASEEDDVLEDWEAADFSVSSVVAKVGGLAVTNAEVIKANSAEDRLEEEQRLEQERLRVLGIERAKREEEARIKRYSAKFVIADKCDVAWNNVASVCCVRREEEEKHRAEMERAEREAAMRKETSRRRRQARDEAARAARTPARLRAPISCIMGHVDTGKTKLLDKIRHTNVQEGEAGGITQQIGATAFSREVLLTQTASMQRSGPFDIRIPGLLVIDTPGHESFTNLRSRGSSLCDIAILVIDLMHGLEPQTIESINLLKRRRCPFLVALNKVDRCYNWQSVADSPFRESYERQDENCKQEFNDRAERVIVQLMEQGLNAALYWKNDDLAHTVSLVPTSAVTGEGVPDLLRMIITLTQDRLERELMFMDVLQCTVLEVKVIEGLGHTMDVVLVNGTLREGDTIIVSTMEGPVVTNIRALLTPPPNRESRVKSEYVHHSVLQGAIGVKIVAPDIARAVAGTPILVVQPEDDLEDVKEDVQSDLSGVMKALSTDNQGVMVHASTLGALEALLQFLREECNPPIPVSHVNIGPIHKKDIMRASIMHDKGHPEFATILAFDVKVDSEAQEMAEELKVRIFTAEIIYHLFDQFSRYMDGINEARRKEAEAIAVYPCVLKVCPHNKPN
jgi:translation initiation factor 5B